eukprot:scaffold8243_cov59-Phaeocystis_antarctica.AAC.1
MASPISGRPGDYPRMRTLLLRARSGYKGNLKVGYTPRYKWTKQHARLVGEVPVGVDFGAVIETGAVSL